MDNRALNKAKSGDGTLIAYERQGDGPPVVLVGGALCTAASDAPPAGLLASAFSVFTYDRRGCGTSGDTAPYAVERELEDLAAVIAATGGSASVHGMSSGAALALEGAAAGLPITRVSAYEPPFTTDPAAHLDAGRGPRGVGVPAARPASHAHRPDARGGGAGAGSAADRVLHRPAARRGCC